MKTFSKHNKKPSAAGFTLVEIMAAMLILLVVVLGATAMMSQLGVQASAQGNARVAMDLVNAAVENAQRTDYDSLGNSTPTVTINGRSYTVTTTVTELSTPSNRKEVNVSITYRGHEISAETVVIEAYRINNWVF